MADSGDIDDDLFADLYDADDSTNRATSAVEAPKPAAQQVPDSVPVQPPAQETVAPSYNTSSMDAHQNHSAPQQDYYSGGHNGVDHNQSHGHHHAGTPHADHDDHKVGTGIKEDG
ncbi:RNA-binding protein [Penicillium diatomitis]|uniref:RNA-binding protein n=1 Tax=Penicillium diatomitis TaxID=2819901 RepID=A0A9W9WT48_9EURO|nr:RNA-binding protein [Penicillium diatomitis]KAJ5475022.1 RNA-binding protein [Penicillium diatomitis]